MKICYPIRNTDGQEFRSPEEVMQLINGEDHGTWLLGTNQLWHGGIHISDVSNPFSALNPDALNTGEPVPVQFMADGTIVAYRINKAYLTAPYCGKDLRYSSSFVLVKSQCIPDPEKKNSWLEFYCLYQHLAALDDYPASPCYKVKAGHNNIALRNYVNGQHGLPEGEEQGAPADYAAPEKTGKRLNAGDRFVSSRTGRFYLTKNGQTSLVTFGLVRLLNGNPRGNEQYWVTLDPALVEQDGETADLMPDWMQKAKEKGKYDTVELTDGAEEWKVSAGSPVGFMGLMETPSESGELFIREWFVHLELLSVDPNMPAFLSNPGKVEGRKSVVIAAKGTPLYIRHRDAGQPAFSATSATLSAQCVRDYEAAARTADSAGHWWYNISGSGWLPQSDVTEVEQYDLLKQGFQAQEKNRRGDVMDSPYESWVTQALGAVSEEAEQARSMQYGQVPAFYRELAARIDSNRGGNVTAEEIRQALTIRDPLVRRVVNRLVVKHHSEWFGGRTTGAWERFYKDLDPLEVKFCQKWQADQEWMSASRRLIRGRRYGICIRWCFWGRSIVP